MKILDILEASLAVIALLGITYKLARAEREIYEAIDKNGDILIAKVTEIEKKLDKHCIVSDSQREHLGYLSNALDEKIEHRTQRLHGMLNQVMGFIQSLYGNVPIVRVIDNFLKDDDIKPEDQ